MEKNFKAEAKKLRNIVLFNPEVGPDDLSNTEASVFIKVADGKLLFEILSFRYLLTGKEQIDSNQNLEMVLPLKRVQDIVKSFSDNTIIDPKVYHKQYLVYYPFIFLFTHSLSSAIIIANICSDFNREILAEITAQLKILPTFFFHKATNNLY